LSPVITSIKFSQKNAKFCLSTEILGFQLNDIDEEPEFVEE